MKARQLIQATCTGLARDERNLREALTALPDTALSAEDLAELAGLVDEINEIIAKILEIHLRIKS